jgi:hypothetical protein
MSTGMRADLRPGADHCVDRGINRGVLIVGVAGVALTLANVFATFIFAALACFDSCPSALSMVQASPLTLLFLVLLVAPALALIGVGWVWELVILRRMRRPGSMIAVALAPLLALVVVLALAAIAAARDGLAPQDFNTLHLWSAGFALALWPLLVSVVAFIQRERRAPPLPPGSKGAGASA